MVRSAVRTVGDPSKTVPDTQRERLAKLRRKERHRTSLEIEGRIFPPPKISRSEYEHLIREFSLEVEDTFVWDSENPRIRDRYIAGIAVLAEFLEAIRFSRGTVGRLFEIAEALRELDYGIVSSFLKPAPRMSKTLDPADIWSARAYFAIIVDYLIAEGSSRRAACRFVAERPGFPAQILTPKAKSAASAIEHWHRSFEGETVKSQGAQAIFGDRARTIKLCSGPTNHKRITVLHLWLIAMGAVPSAK